MVLKYDFEAEPKKRRGRKKYHEIKEYHLISPKPMNESQILKSRQKLERFIEVDTNRTKIIEKKIN